MPIEYEAKILEINPEEMERRIRAAGGQKIGDMEMCRYVYDVTPGDPAKWIRLRKAGTDVTLTVKQIISDTIDGTEEIEVRVSDFADTNALLEMIGFVPKSYQENNRESFTLAGARLEIDRWPHIPPYLEIEANSSEEVINIATVLGYTEQDLTAENTITIYRRYGIDLDAIPHLRF